MKPTVLSVLGVATQGWAIDDYRGVLTSGWYHHPWGNAALVCEKPGICRSLPCVVVGIALRSVLHDYAMR